MHLHSGPAGDSDPAVVQRCDPRTSGAYSIGGRRLRQPRKPRIGAHETGERLRAIVNDLQPGSAVRRESPAAADRGSTSCRSVPAIDLIGVRELFSSWPITRTRRRQACRSSSRSARLRSEITSSSCGQPPLAERAAANLPAAARRPQSDARVSSRSVRSASFQAERVRACSPASVRCGHSRASPARFTSRKRRSIEGEYRDVDFADHLAAAARPPQCLEPGSIQHLAEGIQLMHDFAQHGALDACSSSRTLPGQA
jgi:hypothetical protein